MVGAISNTMAAAITAEAAATADEQEACSGSSGGRQWNDQRAVPGATATVGCAAQTEAATKGMHEQLQDQHLPGGAGRRQAAAAAAAASAAPELGVSLHSSLGEFLEEGAGGAGASRVCTAARVTAANAEATSGSAGAPLHELRAAEGSSSLGGTVLQRAASTGAVGDGAFCLRLVSVVPAAEIAGCCQPCLHVGIYMEA